MSDGLSWEELLREAQAEENLDKLLKKVYAAEDAMFLRMQEMSASADGLLESLAIEKGCQELLEIKTKKLKRPNIPSYALRRRPSSATFLAPSDKLQVWNWELAMTDTSQSWVQAYQAAVQETDPTKLHERVMAAESAIYLRWIELKSSSDGHLEREAIDRACAGLPQIKSERLRWPASCDLQ
ncbi:MAG: hypothetical protein WCA91_05520 [Candidatus Acidiferrales bacterium]